MSNGFPNMAEALWGTTNTIDFEIVNKTVSDHEVVEGAANIVTFQGDIQPIPPQKLTIKPEGQRRWKWYTMRTTQEMSVDYIVQDPQGKQYRVMSVTDWHSYGYFEYELVQGPPQP